MGWSLLAAGVALGTEGEVDYLRDIKPVLAERCYACHGALKQKHGLRVDTAAAIRRGGKDGPVVVEGDAEGSELVKRIRAAAGEERMPPEGKPLSAEEIAAIEEWIGAGAPVPAGERGEDDPREHWAFQRIERPEVPAGDGGNPIDAFLAAKRGEAGVAEVAEAERSILIRRLYLDLCGLPPSRAQLRDGRRWEEIVDELLESPQHGERWGRHWMDVWRYSDWYGLDQQLRYSQKHIWHWRDWIVESLNADKGYDRMIHEMLAGDELAPADLGTVRATGFLARNYYLFNRTTWLDSTIEHTAKAFVGLTLNCAKCHDHKYDPIEARDYYRWRAIFEPHQVRLDEVPGEPDLEKDGIPRVFDEHLEAPTWLHRRGDEKSPVADDPIEAGVPVLFAGFAPEVAPVSLPLEAWAPGARREVQEARLAAARTAVERARGELGQREEAERVRLAASAAGAEQDGGRGEDGYVIRERFDGRDETRWGIEGNDWEIAGGVLRKRTADRANEVVGTRAPHPRDFEVSCRYTLTGGATYKSVGIRFDRSEDGTRHSQVYTSAHEPDPKVQVSHTKDGMDQYPAAGRVSRALKVGETHELRFAVRGRLLNVWLDGEFVLAYELPERPEGGRLALSGFDAVVEFEELSLRALPDGVVLQPAAAAGPTREGAEASLAAAAAELAAMEAVIAADRARSAENFEELAGVAVEREAAAAVARGEADRLAAGGDEKKRKEAEDRLAKARQRLEDARGGKGRFASLRASRKALETPEHNFDQYPNTWPEVSSGRRSALAQWMTSRENPLTARVAVNHIWLRHFGAPLVESVFDFGRRAERPEHLELLDYLAMELIESGWSMRHLHRLMVTSRAYRMTSSSAGVEARTLAIDGGNRFYWRMNARRMESEVVRDSLLSLAGVLDLRMGGPSLDPGAGGTRRSIYFKHSRDDEDKLLSMFDHADHLQCYRRSESIVPQQALALSNSGLALEMGERLADRIAAEGPEAGDFVDRAFEAILARVPDEEERAACHEFCERLREGRAGADGERVVRIRLVHALLNHNDFVTIR